MRKLTNIDTEFPKVILIDNFSGCNLKCSICDHKNITRYRKVERMKLTLFSKIINEISDIDKDTRVWMIYFGDPFLCYDMPERIRYAKKEGLTDVVLNTNGVALTTSKAIDYINAGLDTLYVGIDAFLPLTYKKIRVGGDYMLVVRNVLEYRDLLEEYGTGTQKLYVQFVETSLNIGEKDRFCAFWKEFGVAVKVRPMVSWGGLIANGIKPLKDRVPCGWVMDTLPILSDGRVAACATDVHGRLILGNIKNKTIREIWNGSHKLVRKLHYNKYWDKLPRLCKKCTDWNSYSSEVVE